MPFQLKNPSASRYDLNAEQFAFFMPILEMVRGYGKAHIMREAIIVQIVREYGGKKAAEVIERFCARPMTSLDRLQSLLDGQEPLEFEKPVKVNEMPGRERTGSSEPKNIGTFSLDEMKGRVATDTAKASQPPSARKGLFSQSLAVRWLADRGFSVETLEEYFLQAGVDYNQNRVYQLRKEYQ